jgi:nucleoside-diphosphate-sugar epimerase
VTGASGFIGGHLVRRLVGDGFAVRVLVRPDSEAGSLAGLGVEIARGDLADRASLARAAAGCAVVYHLAALTSIRSRSEDEFEATNVLGSANLAAAAAEAGARRFVHVSSCGVYGFRNRFPADEATPLRPDTPYRRSKARGESAVLECADRTGLPVVIARIASIYGPRATNWARLCRSIQSGGFRMIGNGRNRLHLTHVTDIVDGFRRCAETPGIERRCYNLAAAEAISIGALVARLAEALGANVKRRALPALPFRTTRHVDLALTNLFGLKLRRLHSYDLFLGDRVFDISRARKELGYDPRVSAEEGLPELVADLREAGRLARCSGTIRPPN